MTFSEAEVAYLRSQTLGRLATQQPDGTLQANPVGFVLNDDGTIDIGGHHMSATRKFRNVRDNGRVAFVVDDLASRDPWWVRCVEIRGTATTATTVNTEPGSPAIGDGGLIRITPGRVLSFGLEGPQR